MLLTQCLTGADRVDEMTNIKIAGVLALFLVCSASRSAAQSGTFTPTSNMTIPRASHTATLLKNGKVLIAGGYGLRFSNLASAELYDPASETFTRTGDMAAPRAGHTATLLPDGRVLIAGGLSATGGGVAGAELYDPASGTFASTGNMIQSAGNFHAELLASGKVLIAGGLGLLPPTAELYDPSSATFSSVSPVPFTVDQLTRLADGRVLIQGEDEDEFLSLALYDPVTGGARLDLEPIQDYWMAYTATLLTTGKVLDTMLEPEDNSPVNSARLYDPSTSMFATRNMAAPRRYPTATLLPDATVLIAGGGNLIMSYYESNSAELYDPVADKFSVTGSMTENRERHTATVLPDGTVLVAGGGINGLGTVGAEIYHPNVLIPAPVLFSLSGDGRGQGAIWHADGRIASSDTPAIAGEALAMYTTSLVDGGVIPPQVAIGGQFAEILFFGKASGYPAVNQVNFRVPGGVASGSVVPVRLSYLGRSSNEVTIGVQ
jgi:hypothetical protein